MNIRTLSPSVYFKSPVGNFPGRPFLFNGTLDTFQIEPNTKYLYIVVEYLLVTSYKDNYSKRGLFGRKTPG